MQHSLIYATGPQNTLSVKISLYGFLGRNTHLSDIARRDNQLSDATRPSCLAENIVQCRVLFPYGLR